MNLAAIPGTNTFSKLVLMLFFIAASLLHIYYNNWPIKQWNYHFKSYNNKSSNSYNKVVHEQDVFGGGDEGRCQQLKTFFSTTINPPGVILRVKGGIGNQLFQYASAYALARDLNWPLYLDYAVSPSIPPNFQPSARDFALDKFQIQLKNLITKSTKLTANVTPFNEHEMLKRPFLKNSQFVGLEGYFQSIEFWRNYQQDIKAMFKPKKCAINSDKLKEMVQTISNSSRESVCVHVRRGDYTYYTKYFLPISFQRIAMRKMIGIFKSRGKGSPSFFVFSDDIFYALEKLKDFRKDYNVVFVSKEIPQSSSIEEFYLMTLCKHIIFPNSTYSWWIAYLIKNKDKIVITTTFKPEFMAMVNVRKLDKLYGNMFHPKDWIVINPFTGGLEI